jgi:hypothetical protein
VTVADERMLELKGIVDPVAAVLVGWSEETST